MVIGPAFKKNDDMQHGGVLLDTTKATADSTQTEPRMDTYFSRRIKGPPFERKEEMQYEGVRLETFKNWPNWAAVWPTLLAKAGFYYTKTADQVACFSCSGRLKTWEAGDSPLTEHKRFFPQCRFVTGRDSSNVPLGGMIETPEVPPGGQNNHTRNVPPGEACNEPVGHQSGRRGDYYRNLATRSAQRDGSTSLTRLTTEINQQYPRGQYESLPSSARRDRPAHCIPRMLTGGTPLRTDRNLSTLAMKLESKRLESFTDWPTRSYARPEKLAKAGLYYLGIADRVKCAFCNGILRNWEPRDEPKMEHRKLFPNCAFLRDARAVGNVTIEEERVNIQQTSQVISLLVTSCNGNIHLCCFYLVCGATYVCFYLVCGASYVCFYLVYGASYVCFYLVCGATYVCFYLVCGATYVCFHLVCGATYVCFYLVCGATYVCFYLVCGASYVCFYLVCGATYVCFYLVCGATYVCFYLVCGASYVCFYLVCGATYVCFYLVCGATYVCIFFVSMGLGNILQ